MLIINLIGVFLIALIVWWFWLYKPTAILQQNEDLTVVVESGNYSPSRISLKA